MWWSSQAAGVGETGDGLVASSGLVGLMVLGLLWGNCRGQVLRWWCWNKLSRRRSKGT